MSWSSSDNFFVNSKLEVFSVDLFSEPLELTQSKVVVYDGPKGDDFKRFLRSRNFQVNRQGKAIVRVQKRDDDGEFVECQYDSFVLEMVVPLGPFGFPNIPLSKPQMVNELRSLLDNSKAELAKKNDSFNELQSLLDNTKSEFAKKNDAFDELQRILEDTKAELALKNDALNGLMKQKIDQDWNIQLAKKNDAFDELQSLLDNTKSELAKKNDAFEQFRLTIVAITNSMKKVFVDFGLEPPASGDPESVLRFVEMLHDLILDKEFGPTFLVAANEILASIASMFEKRTGINIGMETTNSTPITPARLIKTLSTLRGFMVDSHFFIDGSVIVRDFRLMNEDDLPIIFRDSAADVAELKQKKKGTESIDNIDNKDIFYGYFNIPMVGMFKGVLTRVHVNLPDEIMVKLQVGKHNLNGNRFWFVYANGSGVFQKEFDELTDNNLQVVKFSPSRVLGDRTNFFEFLRRMNRTFVNEKGIYLKFDFIAAKFSGRVFLDSMVRYYNKDGGMYGIFKLVQYDVNTPTTNIIRREAYIPMSVSSTFGERYPPSWIVNEALGKDCAFTFNDFCFMGKIMKASATFRENALVNVFFEQNQHGENCYVDALATTFFVLKTEKGISWSSIEGSKAPKFT